MKEQIEFNKIVGILESFGRRIRTGALWKVNETAKDILDLIPNNDWLEYPKHKPSGRGQYVVAVEDGFNIEIGAYGVLDTFEFTNDIFRDSDVIAFKPIPVEPFVKKNKYVEVLEFITSSRFIDMEAENYNIIYELKAKIENGDLI